MKCEHMKCDKYEHADNFCRHFYGIFSFIIQLRQKKAMYIKIYKSYIIDFVNNTVYILNDIGLFLAILIRKTQEN